MDKEIISNAQIDMSAIVDEWISEYEGRIDELKELREGIVKHFDEQQRVIKVMFNKTAITQDKIKMDIEDMKELSKQYMKLDVYVKENIGRDIGRGILTVEEEEGGKNNDKNQR